uniref:Plasmodium variant antigen protein Cir/Yir/Bir n=1 Tax=Rhabditophanes sp. KR3021 TaxID=114890 RepID=A0AC35TQQ4_9BILA
MIDLNKTFMEAKTDQNKDDDSNCTKNILHKIIKDKEAFKKIGDTNNSLTGTKKAKAILVSYEVFQKI